MCIFLIEKIIFIANFLHYSKKNEAFAHFIKMFQRPNN